MLGPCFLASTPVSSSVQDAGHANMVRQSAGRSTSKMRMFVLPCDCRGLSACRRTAAVRCRLQTCCGNAAAAWAEDLPCSLPTTAVGGHN